MQVKTVPLRDRAGQKRLDKRVSSAIWEGKVMFGKQYLFEQDCLRRLDIVKAYAGVRLCTVLLSISRYNDIRFSIYLVFLSSIRPAYISSFCGYICHLIM